MGCLFVLFGGMFPRLALLIVWIARPKLVDAAFDTWILPLLGLIFFPFATLIYVILYRTGGLDGLDWFWVVLAAVFDIGHTADHVDAAAEGHGVLTVSRP